LAVPEVIELEERQVPDGIWKQPEESAIPFANVEVAVEEELMPPPIWRRPAMLTLFAKVVDAVERKPAKEEKPVEERPPV
jgi:hypothetical protein